MGITPLKAPIACPGGYSLDMYCKYENPAHGFDPWPEHFYAESGAAARRMMRQAGWVLHKDGTATCPKCASALKAR